MKSKLISTYYHKDDERNVAMVMVPSSGEGYYVQVEYLEMTDNETYILGVFLDLADAENAAEDWALGVER